jgi:hypothetical protein
MIGLFFWMLTLAGCGYAAMLGGREGRWAACLIISASLLTIPATRLGAHWARSELGVMSVDAALLVGLYVLSLRSRRYFPIWMAGFHLVAVGTHLGTLIAPDFTPRIYRALASLWAVPMTVCMVLGVALDRGLTRSDRGDRASDPQG